MKKVWNGLKKHRIGLLIVTLILGIQIWKAENLANSKLLQTQRTYKILPVLLPISSLANPNTDEAVNNISGIERIDAFVTEQIKRHGVPGLALALVDGEQVVFMKGYGKADQTGRPITPQTPFILASVSKPITAVAVMQLVDAGKIELDAPVRRYLPEFRLADPAASSQITVRHLLLHTSGIPNTACDTRINAETLAEYVAELQTVKLDSPVGTRHNYCSGNYNVLGRIIEVISGQTFGEYMQQHIFNPLDMQQSFSSEEQAQAAGMANGYQWFFGLAVPTHHRYNPSQLSSGYMISSAEDLSHFLISQLNEGRYLDTDILSTNSISAMQVPGTTRGADGGYGFGWVIAPKGGVPAVWHDGVNVNFHSLLLMQPETQRGVVVLMNSFGIVPYESAYKEIEDGVVRLLADMEPAPLSQSLGAIYLTIDVLLAIILAIALWPLLGIRKWHRWLLARQQAGNLPLTRVSLRSAWEISFALLFLMGIRLFIVTGLGAQSWYEVLTVFPDFVIWIWAFAFVVLSTGLIRLKLIFQARREGDRKNEKLVIDAPVARSL
jgi:CubicO group peptidase (beta-lactamase class C family)